jgi:hypothetical protein
LSLFPHRCFARKKLQYWWPEEASCGGNEPFQKGWEVERCYWVAEVQNVQGMVAGERYEDPN